MKKVVKKQLAADIGESQDSNQVKPETRIAMFWIDKDQAKRMSKFSNDHRVCQRGAIGGAVTYSFTPTSLGEVVKVKCACGKELDVSDYEGW
jgi:hypothetical protein